MRNLINVYEDTLSLSDPANSDFYKTSTQKLDFSDISWLSNSVNVSKGRGKIIVENIDSVSAIAKYNESGRCCVLNMASYKRPGGGVARGSRAQEECLFRCSNLHYCIPSTFYPLAYNECLYTPRATFFKDFNYDLMAPVECDVITIAAFNLNEQTPFKYDINTKNKIRLMCSAPAQTGVKNLILGAWGCGVFKNDPEIMSKFFREILVDEGYAKLYDNVIFAIINDHNSVANNYSIFQKNLK